MSSIDEQFVEFIVKSLVSNPDAVVVERSVDEKGVLLELTVDPEDLGRVIGKRGATAQSLRTLLRALGTKNEARYNLKIVDNGPAPEDRASAAPKDDAQSSADDAATTQDEPADTAAAPVAGDDEDEAQEESSLASKTRKELAEFDDLDL